MPDIGSPIKLLPSGVVLYFGRQIGHVARIQSVINSSKYSYKATTNNKDMKSFTSERAAVKWIVRMNP